MAKLVLTNAFVSINAVDLSNRVRQVAINYEGDAVEQTTMGDLTHNFLGGLRNYSVEVTFAQDFAAANVDATMFALVGTAVAVEVRPTTAARSATNPGYNATMLVQNYNPFGTQVGALHEASASFVPGGASPTLLRSTA
jgi:hypothetical protein